VMKGFRRLVTGMAVVAVTAGSAFAQAQAPITKSPPPARTPSSLVGPPTGLPRAGTAPQFDRRATVPAPPGTQVIDPRTGQPMTVAPNDPNTPSVLTPQNPPR
jgi:hypothetical protein